MIVARKTTMAQMPNFFIVGAMKAGTTSLYRYLQDIPGIYMSTRKEPYYFSRKIEFGPEFPDIVIRKKKEYLKLFSGARGEKAIGEASPGYLWDPDTPSLIRKNVPSARIVMILRDPVERAFSHWSNRCRSKLENRDFREAIHDLLTGSPPEKSDGRQYVDFGFYSRQVERYLHTFRADRIKILIFEEFIQDPESTVKEVLKFLGVDPGRSSSVKYEAHNAPPISKEPRGDYARWLLKSHRVGSIAQKVIPASIRKKTKESILYAEKEKPRLKVEDRELLTGVYSEDVRKLAQILKRPLPWKSFQYSISNEDWIGKSTEDLTHEDGLVH